MATFIPYLPQEEEQYLELSRTFTKLRSKGKDQDEAFYQECAKLASNPSQSLELLNKLADEHQLLFSEVSSQEIESFFLLALQPLTKPETDQQKSQQFTSKLLSILTSTTDDKSVLRLKILGHMYNILNKPNLRYEIFSSIIKFAGASKHVEVILPHLKDIDKRIKEWNINSQQTRELYRTIRNVLRDSNRSMESHKWTTKFLSTFENSYDNEDVTSVQQEAVKSILDSIRLPNIYQFDNLLDLFAVKQLENDQTHSKVFQLLKIFVNDTVEAFSNFNNSNPGFLQSLGLNEQECFQKIRLLSLASLGATQHEIPYGIIAKTLQIDESEVESWIILAVTESIIEAKMDQQKNIVTFNRVLHRVFSRNQWKQLGETLNTWKENMNLILKTLQDCKQQQLQHIQQLQQQQQQNGLSPH